MLTVEDKKFDWKTIPLEDCLKGNALDAHYTIKIYQKLLEELREKNLETLYAKLISPVTPILIKMEYDGLLVDQKELASLKSQILAKLALLEDQLKKSDGLPPEVNFSSSHDLIQILYSLKKNENKEWVVNDQYGFGLYPFSRTETEQPQTNEDTLVVLQEMVEEEFARRGLNEKQAG